MKIDALVKTKEASFSPINSDDGDLLITTEDYQTLGRPSYIPAGTVLMNVFGNLIAFIPGVESYNTRFWSLETTQKETSNSIVKSLRVRKMAEGESVVFSPSI